MPFIFAVITCLLPRTSTHYPLPDIRITSLSNPHSDLPTRLQIFAQLIVEGGIVKQTVAMDAEDTQDPSRWTLRFDCEVLVPFVQHPSIGELTPLIAQHTHRAL
jgi:hypothetical protein